MRLKPEVHTIIYYADVEDGEVELVVSYHFTPGYPETGPSYDSGGEPGCGPEIEVVGMKVGDAEVPDWFFKAVVGKTLWDFIADNHEPEGPPDYERE